MAPPKGVCEVCHQVVSEAQTAAYPITGWETEGKTAGVKGRKRVPNRIVHAVCLDGYLKRGEQEAML